MANPFLDDPQWRDLFAELRIALREVAELESRVLDASAPVEEWTKAWGEYAGLLGRIGFLHQRLLARRIQLLPD